MKFSLKVTVVPDATVIGVASVSISVEVFATEVNVSSVVAPFKTLMVTASLRLALDQLFLNVRGIPTVTVEVAGPIVTVPD